ncbi:MAG: tRNA uridine-5-carboxymethylaminomethyl(34) synthesis GTPase MnmE, partial [Myxococcota bacterium]
MARTYGTPDDTIVARATGPGVAAVAVVRLSGPQSVAIAEGLTGRALAPSHQMALRPVLDDRGERLDRGLAVWMAAPNSYTGQDVVEFHLHGSPVVVQAVIERCYALGARAAGPGEFTERAFVNGRLDLA